jgi:hypothetical protein
MNCNLKVVNASSHTDNIYKINYIPFSITTIKLLIQNEENFDVNFLIKPLRFQNNDDFCGGYDDEKNGLKIIWGGGQENGVEFTVKGNTYRYAFLFVFPETNSKLVDYNLTLQINKTTGDSNTNKLEEIKLKLFPIQTGQPINNIAHQRTTINNSDNISKVTFEGNLVSHYYPRWFPELYGLIANTDNYYQSEPLIANISFKIYKKSHGLDKDRIVLEFKEKERATIEGDMDGANYHIDIFKFNDSFILRIWFLWISKKQFIDRNNLEPLQEDVRRKGISFNPELPDFERFDIVFSPDGNILAICTDFHWQEYWYKLVEDNTNMIGVIAKALHPIEESLGRLFNRNFVENKYEDIITDLSKITSLSKNFNPQSICTDGEVIDTSLQNRKIPLVRGRNFFRSHVPYVRNGNILTNMISHVVDKHV